jgi:DtxR family transcriptional regulator, Mn-dependent transcriptional regulator
MPKSGRTGVIQRIIDLAGRRGAAARRAREQDEDALKHLHECERASRPCTVAEVAGRLGIGEGEAAELATRLSARGLAHPTGAGLELTGAGRSYARRVLRTHRLWERYLADRTGVPAGEWHASAEQVEHELTPDEAEALATRLGDPRYDPHGDPIPTAAGEVPDPRGVPLARVAAGRSVLITHLEDEPREVFDRMLALGLTPGLAVDVVASAVPDAAESPAQARRVVVRVRGVERELAAVDASNVTVEVLPAGRRAPGRRRTLAEAGLGEAVRVVGIVPACQGPQRRRLLDLGVVPGTRIVPELVSTSGDPVAYRIRGAVIALRREQAAWIEVEYGEESA